MLGRDDPPEMIAASFALGVAISFTPLFGLHWVIALTLAFLLGLRKMDVLLGTLVVNPLTIGPVSAVALPLGRLILRARNAAATEIPWSNALNWDFWRTQGPHIRRVGIHWGMGMFALSFVAGALTYVGVLALVRSRRTRLAASPRGPGDGEA
jgi:uncharacterized protein (DUF2062 family)